MGCSDCGRKGGCDERKGGQRVVLSPETADPKDGLATNFAPVLPGCFSMLGIPVLRGRELTARDLLR